MLRPICICNNEKTKFTKYIEYRNEKVFKDYEGVIIGKCNNCGILKILKLNNAFNPEQSRVSFYEENKVKFIELYKPLVQKLTSFKKQGRLLDVGCSSGILLNYLKKIGFDVYGIEPNQSAYIIAQKKLGKKIFGGTLKQFIQKNKLSFDIIIYNHVLEHIDNIDEEIKSVKKILNKNGLLIIGVPNISNIIFLLRQKYWESLMPNEHIWHFGKNQLCHYLIKQGFKILDVSFSDQKRDDYPILKKIYFSFLSVLNKMFNTGESMLLFSLYESHPRKNSK